MPRVDPRAPTVIVTGIQYDTGVTADDIKVCMENLGNVRRRVKRIQCLEPVGVAIVEFERSEDAMRVGNLGRVTVPYSRNRECPVCVYVLRPLPSDPPSTAHTALAGMPVTQTVGQQWRHHLMTMDVGQLQTLARAGGLTDDVKDTLRRVPRGEYKQQLITRCEALVSDNNIAQAILSVTSQYIASHTRTATADPHDARQSQANNTDSVSIVIPPATTPGAASVIPSTASLGDTHLKTVAPAITPEVLSDATPFIPPTATPDVTPVLPPTATSDVMPAEECPDSEVEVFYDCLEEMDPATVHTAMTGGIRREGVGADISRMVQDLQAKVTQLKASIQSDVTQLKASIQSDVTQLKASIQNDVTQPYTRHNSEVNQTLTRVNEDVWRLQTEISRLQNQHVQHSAHTQARDKKHTDLLAEAQGQTRADWVRLTGELRELKIRVNLLSNNSLRQPGREEAGGRLGVDNPSDSDSVSGRSSSTMTD